VTDGFRLEIGMHEPREILGGVRFQIGF